MTCKGCGAEFAPPARSQQGQQRYCEPKCAKRAESRRRSRTPAAKARKRRFYLRHRDRLLAYANVRARALAAERKAKAPALVTCLGCGSAFQYAIVTNHRTYCTHRCWNRARNRRRKADRLEQCRRAYERKALASIDESAWRDVRQALLRWRSWVRRNPGVLAALDNAHV